MTKIKVVGIIQTDENDYTVQVSINPNIEGLNGRYLNIPNMGVKDILHAFGIIQDDLINYQH